MVDSELSHTSVESSRMILNSPPRGTSRHSSSGVGEGGVMKQSAPSHPDSLAESEMVCPVEFVTVALGDPATKSSRLFAGGVSAMC